MRPLFSQQLTLVLFCLLSASCVMAGKHTTTVTCQLNRKIGSAVFLYRVENGEAVSLGFKWIDDKNACTFTFEADKAGIYYLRRAGVHSPIFNYGMYLRPGDVKTVQVYTSNLGIDFDSCQVIDPKKETGYLQQWTTLFNGICRLGANRKKREEFFSAYTGFVQKAKALKAASAETDKHFHRLFAAKIDTDLQYVKAGAFFYFGERMNSGCDTSVKHQPFYRTLLNDKDCDAGWLASEHGIQLMNYILGYRYALKTAGSIQWYAVPLAWKVNELGNEVLKGAYAANYMRSVRSYEQFRTNIEPLQEVINKAGYGELYRKKLDELTVFAKGARAYNFSLPDTCDKLVSLNDLKGKVVVVDLWAMWCASCLQEKPAYERLIEEYQGRNDIVFLGISYDGAGKKDPWKSFVARKGYKGIELLADPGDELMKYYKIEGIPRYMLFDKEGKIVTVDAPRPSGPALKKLIEQILSHK